MENTELSYYVTPYYVTPVTYYYYTPYFVQYYPGSYKLDYYTTHNYYNDTDNLHFEISDGYTDYSFDITTDSESYFHFGNVKDVNVYFMNDNSVTVSFYDGRWESPYYGEYIMFNYDSYRGFNGIIESYFKPSPEDIYTNYSQYFIYEIDYYF